MKRFIIVALALMMVAALCAGCRRADKKDEPMATTTAETTPMMTTTTAPTTPRMTTPTEPILPDDSIGENGGNGGQDGTNGGQNGTNGGQNGANGGQNGTNGGVGGENSRSTQRGRMRRIG